MSAPHVRYRSAFLTWLANVADVDHHFYTPLPSSMRAVARDWAYWRRLLEFYLRVPRLYSLSPDAFSSRLRGLPSDVVDHILHYVRTRYDDRLS